MLLAGPGGPGPPGPPGHPRGPIPWSLLAHDRPNRTRIGHWQIYGIGSEWESFEDVGARTISTLQSLASEVLCEADEGSCREVALVSHGDISAVSRLFGGRREINVAERNKLQEEGYPNYCSVTSLHIDKDGQCKKMELHDVSTSTEDLKKA